MKSIRLNKEEIKIANTQDKITIIRVMSPEWIAFLASAGVQIPENPPFSCKINLNIPNNLFVYAGWGSFKKHPVYKITKIESYSEYKNKYPRLYPMLNITIENQHRDTEGESRLKKSNVPFVVLNKEQESDFLSNITGTLILKKEQYEHSKAYFDKMIEYTQKYTINERVNDPEKRVGFWFLLPQVERFVYFDIYSAVVPKHTERTKYSSDDYIMIRYKTIAIKLYEVSAGQIAELPYFNEEGEE